MTLLLAAVLAAVIIGSLAAYGSLASRPKKSPAGTAGDTSLPAPAPAAAASPPIWRVVWRYAKAAIRLTLIMLLIAALIVIAVSLFKVTSPIDIDTERWENLLWWLISLRSFWFLVALFLLGVAILAKEEARLRWGAIAFLAVLATAWLNGCIESGLRRVERGANQGDWSAPEGYVRTVSNGTVVIRRGAVENFYVVGRVRLINNNDYTCLKISPEGRFLLDLRHDGREGFITARSGEKEMVFIQVAEAADCSQS